MSVIFLPLWKALGQALVEPRLESVIPRNRVGNLETCVGKKIKDDINKEIQQQWAAHAEVWTCTGCTSLRAPLSRRAGSPSQALSSAVLPALPLPPYGVRG